MATHSRLREFNPAVEDWISYAERLEFYFTVNEVKEADKQRAVLFSVCGAATYKLIKNLLVPAKPADASFKDIVKLLTEHYQPKPSRVVQRYLFNSRVQKQGESMWLSLNAYLNIVSLQPPLMICYVIAWYVVLMIAVYSAGCWQSQILITRRHMNLLWH